MCNIYVSVCMNGIWLGGWHLVGGDGIWLEGWHLVGGMAFGWGGGGGVPTPALFSYHQTASSVNIVKL